MTNESLETTTSFATEDDDPNFERKLDQITADAQPFIKEHLLTRITHVNCQIIISYILDFMTETNPKPSTRIHTIQILKHLAEFHNPKSFRDMRRDDVVAFLDRSRKSETTDPLHKWVSTYESDKIVLLRFFKWLYGPDIPHKYRPKPDVVKNLPKIKRKEISSYKPFDLWTEADDLMFCKYSPSKRDRAYHMVARNTGCRPHELLGAKIKDLIWINTDTYQVAQLLVNGKTGQGKQPITSAVPYLKD